MLRIILRYSVFEMRPEHTHEQRPICALKHGLQGLPCFVKTSQGMQVSRYGNILRISFIASLSCSPCGKGPKVYKDFIKGEAKSFAKGCRLSPLSGGPLRSLCSASSFPRTKSTRGKFSFVITT